MISLKLEGKGLERLKKLKRVVEQLGNARCDITPTHVIYLHCERQGKKLLETVPAGVRRDIEKRWRPKVEAAVKKAVKDERIYNEGVARAWRYGAYVHADKVWMAAKKGAWGKVEAATVPVKRAAQGSDRTENAAARGPSKPKGPSKPRSPRRPQAPNVGRGKGGGDLLSNYGVRSQGRGRRWYDIQKGRAKHGRRLEGDLTQKGHLIEVFVGTRRIDAR